MKRILVDDMFLTVGTPTTAGSKMLKGYQSLITAEAVLCAEAADYVVYGKKLKGN